MKENIADEIDKAIESSDIDTTLPTIQPCDVSDV